MGVLWRLISEDGSGGLWTRRLSRWDGGHPPTQPALPMAPDNLLEAAQVLSSGSHTFPVQFRCRASVLNLTMFYLQLSKHFIG